MKKETVFFLILTVAAAIVVGSTLGIMNNIQYLAKNGALYRADEVPQAAAKDPAATTEQQKAIAASSAGSSKTVSQDMIMSPQETSQIRDMLLRLGMQEDSDYSQFVMQYQQAHGIRPTGNMDSMTLNTIIEEVKMQRVQALAR
ncbi:MAG: hypothetical protein ACOX6I_10140 [Syntrophomonadaceae bacterium]|jgi:hypothetical protein